MTGCVWHDGDLRVASRESNGFTPCFPSQEPPHKERVGGTAGAWSQEQPTQGLQVMHSL